MSYLLISLLVSQNLFARAYGGTSWDEASQIIQTTDGGYAVAGYTWSFGNDCLVLKIASDGSLSWARTFGGSDYDWAYSIIQTTDGGYAVVGYTDSFGAGLEDLLVFKLASDGSLSWARSFGGANDDCPYSIIQTSDGGYAVAGYTESFGAGSRDIIVLKLASDGSLSWARTFGGTDGDWAYSVIQTSDGGYAVAGYTKNFGEPVDDFIVLKLASDGSLNWARTFGGASIDWAYSIIQTTDGGYAVAGMTWSFGSGLGDFLVLKLASDGSLSWARTFGGTSNEEARSIIQTTDGGYAVAGKTSSFGTGYDDFLVLKLNPDGSAAWARTFGGTDNDWAYSIIQTTDGGYATAGHTESFGAGYWDFLVLTLDANGNYSGCVEACSLLVGNPSPSISSPSVGAVCSPSTSTPTLTTGVPTPTITDACPPAVEEADLSGPRPGITCSALSGGALFISPEAMGIKIYAADGRLAYSGELKKGENRISLQAGVYLWRAGIFKGKVAVR